MLRLGLAKNWMPHVSSNCLARTLRNVASVGKDLAKQCLQQLRHGLAVIGVPWGEAEVEQLAMLIDN